MKVINKKGVVDHAYFAGLHGEKIGVYAPTLLAAKQKAIEHFRPKKRDRPLLWVHIAEGKYPFAE